MEKIWIVTHVSNIDGERLISVVPCADYETAKSEFEMRIDHTLTFGHFGGLTAEKREELFEIEDEGDGVFSINDPCDDYYTVINMEYKEIVKHNK